MDSLPFNVHKAFTENVAYLNIPGAGFSPFVSHYDNRMYAVDFSRLATVPAESGVLASGAPLLKAGKLPWAEVD